MPVYQYTPPAPPRPVPDRPVEDPSEILGIRIESNGALITGPIGARRVYIPLDRPIVPEGMRGHWARSIEVCKSPSERLVTEGQAAAKDNLLITNRAIVAKHRLQIVQTFVRLPSTITFEMLESGRPMVLSAGKHKKEEEILVIYSMPNKKRNYSIIRLFPSKKSINMSNRDSNETAVRCGVVN